MRNTLPGVQAIFILTLHGITTKHRNAISKSIHAIFEVSDSRVIVYVCITDRENRIDYG